MRKLLLAIMLLFTVTVCCGILGCTDNTTTNTDSNANTPDIPADTPTTPTAEDNGKGNDDAQDEPRTYSAEVLSIENGTVDGYNIFVCVPPNTESLSISPIITCSDGAAWELYKNDGATTIPTKMATSLLSGDNTYYILATSADSQKESTYTLTIHRQYEITIVYLNKDYVKNGRGYKTIKTETVLTATEWYADAAIELCGFIINGWHLKDGTEMNHNVFYTIADYPTNSSKQIPLYPDKTAKTFTITFDAGDGTITKVNDATVNLKKAQITVTYNDNFLGQGDDNEPDVWEQALSKIEAENSDGVSVWWYYNENPMGGDTGVAYIYWQGIDYDITLTAKY